MSNFPSLAKFEYTVVGNPLDDAEYRAIKDWQLENLGEEGIRYAGPLFNQTTDTNIYYFSNQDDATLFTLTWSRPAQQLTYVIDPPGGWRWGFPKEIPKNRLADVNAWLVENRYPQREIDSFSGNVPYRIWCE